MSCEAWAEGNLTRDPEWKEVGPGLVAFAVASNRSFKKDDKWEKVTTYFSVVAWGENYKWMLDRFGSGDHVWVRGEPQARGWVDKKGEVKAEIQINVSVRGGFAKLLGKNPNTQDRETAASLPRYDDPDLPF